MIMVKVRIKNKVFFGEGISEILPSRYRAEILRDYEEGRRSLHGSVEPPYERILDYGRKGPKGIIEPISRQKVKKLANTRVSIPKLQEAAAAGTSTLKDEGILSNLSSARIAEQTSQKEDEDGSEKEEKEEKDGSEQGEGGEEGEGEGAEGEGAEGEGEKGVKKVSIMAPKRKLFIDDNMTRKSVETRDQFIPMEYRSANSHYVSSGEPYELALEKRWRDNMNKKIAEQREKSEFLGYMKQWSFAKAQFEQERVRRGESINFGSIFEKRAFQRRATSNITGRASVGAAPEQQDVTLDLSLNRHASTRSQQSSPVKVSSLIVYHENGNKDVTLPKVVDFSSVRHRRLKSVQENGARTKLSISEADISKQKIAQIKKLHENLLFSVRGAGADDYAEDDGDLVNRPVSLSVYDHTKMKNYTPFSVVTARNDSDSLADKQIREVHDLKKRLANIKMKVTIKALENSLLLPSLTTKAGENHLPIPGCKLLMNPFHKERKARGKKKKR